MEKLQQTKKKHGIALSIVFFLLGIKAESELDLNDVGLDESETPFY